MTDVHYWSYIAYSHADEKWARWLHRALESYRIPRRIAGRDGEHGVIPGRLSPVFRDRDELATATSLSENLIRAIQASETMVVICSPQAANSAWVNEEVRLFQQSGRGDRIFCMVVEGDPSTGDCFPPALFEGVSESGLEPLAADPRPWADGKSLTRLKIVSGILGLRLDELRQRDLARKRRLQLLSAVVVVAALALGFVTIQSRIAEQQERDRAEQLATFVVDLGQRLESDVDLETLGMISQEANRHLETLDPEKLTPGTGVKVALAMRQLGSVSQLQGDVDEALTNFQRSHDLLVDLSSRNPTDQDIIFELAQVKWYIGQLHHQEGDFDLALRPYEDYRDLARQLIRMDADNPDWRLELSYSLTTLAALALDSEGVDKLALRHLGQAVEVIESAMAMKPEDATLSGHYATTLAWVAAAHKDACQLDTSTEYRQRALELAEQAYLNEPSNNNLKLNLAYALTGAFNVNRARGELETAATHLRAARRHLGQLSAADPSNVVYLQELRWRDFLHARFLSVTGRAEQSLDFLMANGFSTHSEAGHPRTFSDDELELIYLLDRSEMALQANNPGAARDWLEAALVRLSEEMANDHSPVRKVHTFLGRAQSLNWELQSQGESTEVPIGPGAPASGPGEFMSCEQAETGYRLSLMRSDQETAKQFLDYLKEKGYAEPGFVQFCHRQGGCDI